jgi:putative DNA primase/helicase
VSARKVRVILASDVHPERTRWAWSQRVPIGSLTALAGRQGLGKSTLAVELAARISRGELSGDLHGEPRSVLIASAEDHIAATLVPRLCAANADMGRVGFVQLAGGDGLTLPDDAGAIAEEATRIQAVMVVLDPLLAFVSDRTDSHRDHSVRRVLAPVAGMASSHELAVLGILHLNKSQVTTFLDRVGGSVALTAAPRSVLAFDVDPGDPERRVLCAAKSNLAPLAASLGYRIEARMIPGEDGGLIPTSRIVSLGETDVSAADLLGSEEERGEHDEAVAFLMGELRGGPVPVRQLQEMARSAGIADRTLRRAKSTLRVKSEKLSGVAGRWQWRLPKVATVSGTDTLDTLDPLRGEEGKDGQAVQDAWSPTRGQLDPDVSEYDHASEAEALSASAEHERLRRKWGDDLLGGES